MDGRRARRRAAETVTGVAGLVAGALLAHVAGSGPKPLPPPLRAMVDGYDLAQALDPRD